MPNQGLIAYYKFDEGSGLTTIDSTGYGNNGTLIGNPTWTASVAPTNFTNTNCLNFNGSSSYVSIPKIPLTEKISISAWFKTSVTTGNRTIFGARATASSGDEIVLWTGGSGVQLWFIMHDLTQYVTGGGSFTPNAWNHVVGTSNGSVISVYLNGVSVATSSITGSYIDTRTNTSPIWKIGESTYDTLNTTWFSGSIDDLRIYNRALTPAEITGLYSGSIQPLAGAWSVVRGNPNAVAVDSSGNGNNGTFVNKPVGSAPAPLIVAGGMSMTFNGSSQYVLLTDTAALKPSQITLSAWVYITQLPSGSYYIVERPKNAYSSYILQIDSNGKLLLNIGYTDSSPYIKTLSSSGTLSLNTWHHVVGTYDLTNMFVYIDGVPTSTSFSSAILYTNSTSGATGPRIGVHDNGSNLSGTFFKGSIDDVRIYNRALSASEAATLATGDRGAVDSALVGWWKLDQAPQSMIKGNPTAVAIDSSGNNNTGTYIGSPSPCNAPSALVYDKLGTGVTFNGSSQGVSSQALGQYISTTLDVSNLPSKTYAGWFYWSSLDNNWQGMVGQADGFDNSKTTGLITDATNKIGIYQAYGGGVIGFIANAALAPTLNTWYHIAGVIDNPNNRIQLYINGSSVSSPSVPTMASSSFTTISNKVGIGFMLGGGSYKFNGSVDDVRIYNKALSQLEITDLASGNIGLTDSTLKAWYKFNTNKQSKI